MRFGVGAVLTLLCAASLGCSGSALFRQYEYEEDVYLSLDGSATVYVNGSLAALDALRGAAFDASPSARFDRDRVRAFFSSPVTRVVSVTNSRRNSRRFAHVRLEAADVRRLSEAPAFQWSTYRFSPDGGPFVFTQQIGAASGSPPAGVNWTGRELVAFRLHLPSTILDHNAGEANHKRGNILVWEQTLADRLAGKPLVLSVRIESESILAHALWLFAGSVLAVVIVFAAVVWWIVRRGDPSPAA